MRRIHSLGLLSLAIAATVAAQSAPVEPQRTPPKGPSRFAQDRMKQRTNKDQKRGRFA